jgi:hypothetical protein
VLLVTTYWRRNLTMRPLAPLFGISKSAADRIIDHLGPRLALQPRRRFRKDTVLIVDGTLVPTRDHSITEQSKNYRHSTAHQVVIDAVTRLVVVVGRPLPGNRHDSRGWEESGAKAAVGTTTTIADGGYQGTGLVTPHRRAAGRAELPAWKAEHNRPHKQVRARVEHTFARMKPWKIPRDCRLKGDGIHHAVLGIARLHNLASAGQWAAPGSRSVRAKSSSASIAAAITSGSSWCPRSRTSGRPGGVCQWYVTEVIMMVLSAG